MTTYTIHHFAAELQRERGKRQSTYPKIIDKALKKERATCESENRSAEEIYSRLLLVMTKLSTQQRIQFELLEDAMRALANPGAQVIDSFYHAKAVHHELIRELKMRKRCYPRWVYFKRMDQLAADELIRIWSELCDYWKDSVLSPLSPTAPEPEKEEQP